MFKQWTDVKEPGSFEHPFYHAEGELKIEIRWDEDKDEPILLLDGVKYDELPFLSPDFKLDEQQLSELKATIYLNKQSS